LAVVFGAIGVCGLRYGVVLVASLVIVVVGASFWSHRCGGRSRLSAWL